MKTKLEKIPTSRRSLDLIADRLYWVCVLLLMIAVGSCVPDVNVISAQPMEPTGKTQGIEFFKKFDSFFGFDGKGGV